MAKEEENGLTYVKGHSTQQFLTYYTCSHKLRNALRFPQSHLTYTCETLVPGKGKAFRLSCLRVFWATVTARGMALHLGLNATGLTSFIH